MLIRGFARKASMLKHSPPFIPLCSRHNRQHIIYWYITKIYSRTNKDKHSNIFSSRSTTSTHAKNSLPNQYAPYSTSTAKSTGNFFSWQRQQTRRHISRYISRQTSRHTSRQTSRHTSRQTSRHITRLKPQQIIHCSTKGNKRGL